MWPFQTKSTISQAQYQNVGKHAYALKDMRSYAKEGYGEVSTIYACISRSASNAAKIPLLVKVNGERQEGHDLEKLLAQPNPDEGGVEFRTAAFSWYMLTGNNFTEEIEVNQRPYQLWNWQPYELSISHSASDPRMPSAYTWSKGKKGQKIWPVDPISGESDLMHWRTFNPSESAPFFGQSPLQAAASSGDQLNASDKWRYNTLKNDMSPAGILSTDQQIDSTKRKELSKDLNSRSGFGKSFKKFMLLGGGLKWQSLAMTPKDADWINGTKLGKQNICEAFSVPPQILGIEGSQTFANYAEAREAWYIDGILPMLDLYISELNRWLAPKYGDNVEVYYDSNAIMALEPSRQAAVKAKLESGVLTINEQRELLGYDKDPDPEADLIMINTSQTPLGLDVFTEDEKDMSDITKALKRAGVEDAEQKAFDMVNGSLE